MPPVSLADHQEFLLTPSTTDTLLRGGTAGGESASLLGVRGVSNLYLLMKRQQKSKEVKPSNKWICCTCDGKHELEHAEMMEHLKTVHGIDPKTAKGTKRMLMHTDGDTWFSWQYEWTIGDVTAVQNTISPRSKDDMMRYL